uniref:DUF7754 domain-containing protein n=1 Tax=Meloidogyne enterolobii TaxID=390850 RepID=A0A6V7U990_MELEN|nr:unnamed protein product [Meloidogyne enterolobii]
MAGNSDELNFIEKVRKSAKLGLNEAIKQISYNVVKTGEWEMLQNGIQNIFYCFVKCLLYCRTVRRQDLNNSNYTCDELPPSPIIKWPGVHLISIDSIKDAKIGVGIENSADGVRNVGIILQINEEGVIAGINECCSSGKENLRFKLKNVDLVVKRSERYDGRSNSD